jgi:hypothetical protein
LHIGYTAYLIANVRFDVTFSSVINIGVAESGIDMMGKRPLVGALCFGCAVLLTSSTWAATLEPGQGDLSVNQGQGFQPVNSRVDTKVGDSIMVGPGGSATLTYEDGCTVTVQPGSVTTIAPLSPCASGSNAQTGDGSSGVGGLIVGAAALGALGLGIYGITQTGTAGTTAPASP